MADKAVDIFKQLKLPLLLVVSLWSLEIIELMTDRSFTTWGILPRKVSGLRGIFTAPFIHSDWDHLMSNTVPLFTLSLITVVFYKRIALASILMIYVLTGAMVWLFARGNYVVGASGVVYGLVSFVFWSGVFRRDAKSVVLALIVLTVYSGLFAGILPQEERVSWESHLFGALVGIFTAYLFKNVKADDSVEEVETRENYEESYYLPRDTFAMTKSERARLEAIRKAQEAEDYRNRTGWTTDST
jgi:membrane associated rhomboid family serine protease